MKEELKNSGKQRQEADLDSIHEFLSSSFKFLLGLAARFV